MTPYTRLHFPPQRSGRATGGGPSRLHTSNRSKCQRQHASAYAQSRPVIGQDTPQRNNAEMSLYVAFNIFNISCSNIFNTDRKLLLRIGRILGDDMTAHLEKARKICKQSAAELLRLTFLRLNTIRGRTNSRKHITGMPPGSFSCVEANFHSFAATNLALSCDKVRKTPLEESSSLHKIQMFLNLEVAWESKLSAHLRS